MAYRKKQHIIPQHYLKGFSKERDDPTISTGNKIIYCHNVKIEKRHKSAIKNISYGNYFYGKDELYEVNDLDDENSDEDSLDCKNLEDVLNRFETQHNDLLDHVIDNKNLALTLEEMYSLYYFLILLKTRTKGAREHAVKSIKTISESVGQMYFDKNDHDDLRVEALPDPIVTHTEFMQALLGSIDKNLHLIVDLSAVLLINDTETNFITSDNPVIFYNYIAPKYTKYKITTAFACSGFMMFCPITEKLSILFYDKDLYHVHKHSQTTVKIKEKSDIDSINTLQVLNCNEEIYCYDESEIDYIKNLRSRVEKYIKEPKVTFTKLNKKYKHPDAIGDEIYSQQFMPYYKIRLSFLKFNEESMKIYKEIEESKNKNNIPCTVFRQELRNTLSFKA
ncbi:DUF4238 domain-containing protein [Methanosarcina sp.]|uniref:DUF4238 domain-containing protein n=1 Tax=Methanosarcina sp. TaxID=2213 RepID=UPI003C793FCC